MALDEAADLIVTEEPLLLYSSPKVQVYHGTMKQVIEYLPRSGPADSIADVVITDPPYTDHVHKNIRSVNTSDAGKPRVRKWTPGFEALAGFEHVPLLLGAGARWVLSFCALESFGDYREAAGKDWKGGGCYVRSGIWRKKQAAPQLSGDRPANSCEGIAIMHHRPHEGRIRWNGHGRHAYWLLDEVPDHFVHGRERVEKRHPAQKPASLMNELVGLFSEPDETIFDPYCGSGATGAAALELGRKIILADQDLQWAEFSAARMKELESR